MTEDEYNRLSQAWSILADLEDSLPDLQPIVAEIDDMLQEYRDEVPWVPGP